MHTRTRPTYTGVREFGFVIIMLTFHRVQG